MELKFSRRVFLKSAAAAALAVSAAGLTTGCTGGEAEKTYEVTVAGAVENAAAELAAVRSVDGEPIAPARVRLLRKGKETAELSVTIHEGKNRQIRRMCAAVGLHVKRLRRVRNSLIKDAAGGNAVALILRQVFAVKIIAHAVL